MLVVELNKGHQLWFWIEILSIKNKISVIMSYLYFKNETEIKKFNLIIAIIWNFFKILLHPISLKTFKKIKNKN